jgi:hypothetical protein
MVITNVEKDRNFAIFFIAKPLFSNFNVRKAPPTRSGKPERDCSETAVKLVFEYVCSGLLYYMKTYGNPEQ